MLELNLTLLSFNLSSLPRLKARSLLVAGGHSETLNGRGKQRKTFLKEAAINEASTRSDNPIAAMTF
ncbi:MAG: hypothetical protein F6K31_16375 [Symploca sp. SIO2G7]|nr:hypothetical protein [Symploca sp. SIO2G7]